MNKITASPFQVGDFEKLDLREMDKNMLSVCSEEGLKIALKKIEASHGALTIRRGDEVLGITGFTYVTPWIMELFLFPSAELKKHSIAFARLMKYYRRNVIDLYSWHRLQIISPSDELHRRWVRFLGLEYEGTLKKYRYDGTDADIWSIVR